METYNTLLNKENVTPHEITHIFVIQNLSHSPDPVLPSCFTYNRHEAPPLGQLLHAHSAFLEVLTQHYAT